MGVKLLGKIKIHEIAKKMGLSSKEVLEKAQELGMEVKSHLSALEEDAAKTLENSLKKDKKPEVVKKEKTDEKVKSSSKKEETPVIIRREVIITEEEQQKREEEEKRKKQENRKQDIGFVERNTSKDFNIVYRNKPNKPKTVSELFGLKPQKEEETAKEEKEKKENLKVESEVMQNTKNVIEEVKKPQPVEQKQDSIAEKKPKMGTETKNYSNNNNNNNNTSGYHRNNMQNNYRNNNVSNNNYRNNENNGYNRNMNSSNNGYHRNNNFNNGYNRNNNPRNNNGSNMGNNRNNTSYHNGGRGNNYNGGYNRRPLDEKGIEKNIKNIMTTEIVEKEITRDYNTRGMDKDKERMNNKYEDNKTKKASKNRRAGRFEEVDEGKLKNLKQADRLSHMFDDQDGGMLDYYDLTTARGKRNKKKVQKNDEERNKQKIFKLTEITIPESITVKDLASELKKTSSEVIKKLLNYGIMATINNELDFDTAFLIASEFGVNAVKKEVVSDEDILFDDSEDTAEELEPRPPVVVVMGHVDHGKTSLLDAIRKTNVIEGEAGGITQHIGAYKVTVNGREITFLDTPGHEAFTAMRARGAQVTDIAILVVAADDGVMPQTVEAINHAKSAGIPIIVAVNKIDLPGANVEKIKQELMKYDLVPEEWGGDTIFVPISAKQHQNIDQLLEMVLLVADMKELKANPHKQAKGVTIEARLDKNKGPIASILVQRGTLDVGDTIVVGSSIGRIRAMRNDKGVRVKKAGPSTPVEVLGLTEVPEAGETFYEVKDEKTAKHLIERRKRQAREKSINSSSRVSLDDLFNQIEKGHLKQLNLIIKADVQGTVEAVKQSMEKLSNEEVEVKVIHANAGAVTESDVTLAKVSNAIIIAFNVRPGSLAKEMAERDGVEIKQYSVIYQAIEDVEAAMKGLLDPVYQEKVIGNAEVRQTFRVSGVGTVAGAYVTDGKLERNAGVRVIRENVVIHEGKLASLKRFKDDAKEVSKGFECGIQIENYNDVKEGDIIEAYVLEEVKK